MRVNHYLTTTEIVIKKVIKRPDLCVMRVHINAYTLIAASADEQPPILDIYLDFCLSG